MYVAPNPIILVVSAPLKVIPSHLPNKSARCFWTHRHQCNQYELGYSMWQIPLSRFSNSISMNNRYQAIKVLARPHSFISHLSYIFSGIDLAVNIALNKTAYQSSTKLLRLLSPVAKKGIDGNRDPIFLHGSCTHSRWEKEPFWAVDLGKIYRISHVAITNRQTGKFF